MKVFAFPDSVWKTSGWRTRKKGSKHQKGKKFPLTPSRPRRVVTVAKAPTIIKPKKTVLPRHVMEERIISISRTHLHPMAQQNLQDNLRKADDHKVQELYDYWSKKGKKKQAKTVTPKTTPQNVEQQAYQQARKNTEQALKKGISKQEVLRQVDQKLFELKATSMFSTKGGFGGAPDYDKVQATIRALERIKKEVESGKIKGPKKPKRLKIPKKKRISKKMTHIEKMHLRAKCQAWNIDPQEVDNTLTYYENKRHLHSLAKDKGITEAEISSSDREARQWSSQYEGYVSQLKSELEGAGYEVKRA